MYIATNIPSKQTRTISKLHTKSVTFYKTCFKNRHSEKSNIKKYINANIFEIHFRFAFKKKWLVGCKNCFWYAFLSCVISTRSLIYQTVRYVIDWFRFGRFFLIRKTCKLSIYQQYFIRFGLPCINSQLTFPNKFIIYCANETQQPKMSLCVWFFNML